MYTDTFQQEILLLTGTTFSERQLCENDEEEERSLSEVEKLEQALWSGLLYEMLPELIGNKSIRIWQIDESEFSLLIELSKYPAFEKATSINPYNFLTTAEYN
jgi:hypothetical protein